MPDALGEPADAAADGPDRRRQRTADGRAGRARDAAAVQRPVVHSLDRADDEAVLAIVQAAAERGAEGTAFDGRELRDGEGFEVGHAALKCRGDAGSAVAACASN